jgi:hypothetical protein
MKVKKPDLIILVVIWEFISAFGAVIGISAIFIFALPSVLDLEDIARAGGLFGISVGIFVLLCFIAIAIAAGIGLLTGKEWGRSLGLAHAALTLILIPIGTIIGILVIIYLLTPEVREYFQSGQK